MQLELKQMAFKKWGIEEKGTFCLYQLGSVWVVGMKIFFYSEEQFAYFDNEQKARSIFDQLNSLESWCNHTGHHWVKCCY